MPPCHSIRQKVGACVMRRSPVKVSRSVRDSAQGANFSQNIQTTRTTCARGMTHALCEVLDFR
jgi:hypothetical protein